MNERIRELMAEADRKCSETRGIYDEILAELIVRECMKVASPNYMSTPEDSVYYVEQAIIRIADHFGVEE